MPPTGFAHARRCGVTRARGSRLLRVQRCLHGRRAGANAIGLWSSAEVPTRRSRAANHSRRLSDPAAISRFSNDCLGVQLEANCRDADVFLIQPLAPPVQEHLMELLLMAMPPGARRPRGSPR